MVLELDEEKVKGLVEGEYRYKELFDMCGVQYTKNLNSRKAFIRELGRYYDIKEIGGGKFKIGGAKKEIGYIGAHKNSPFQKYIDVALLERFKAAGVDKLYLTNTEILEMTALVNKDFKRLCHGVINEGGEDLEGEGWIAYSILSRWVNERIKSMEKRGLLLRGTGFRLYYEKEFGGKRYTYHFDVPQDSELEKECLRLWGEGAESVGLGGGQDIGWLPLMKYNMLRDAINKKVAERFKGEQTEFNKVKMVTVLKPTTDLGIIDRAIIGLKESLRTLNAESQRKISTTKRLGYLDGGKKKVFIKKYIDVPYLHN